MPFTSLDRNTVRLADLVYQQLFRAIVSGDVEPGERLVQETIGEQMQVSRTPVRDALVRLESEGILESSGRGGYLVRSVDHDEVHNTYDLRAALEGYAAGQAALKAAPGDLDRIEAAIAEADSQDDVSVDDAFELNRLIHRSVVEAAGNPLLTAAFDSTWDRSQAFRMFARMHSPELQYLHTEPGHDQVLEAIRSGDADKARSTMEQHIRAGLDLQLQALAQSDAATN